MTSDAPRDTSASPVCYLDEVDDIYGGWLTPAETDRLVETVRDLEGRAAAADRAGSGKEAAALREEAWALLRPALPRIRDDRLHAELKALLP